MSKDPTFRLTVQDVFAIRDRGTVVTGKIESGTIKTGDEINILQQGSAKKAVVTGIEMFRKQLQQAQTGDNVGLLLRNIGKQDVQRGDTLVGPDSMFG